MELYYALLKNNRVMSVIVVEKQDDAEIKSYCDEMGFDEFIFTGEDNSIAPHSLKKDKSFIPADFDYLKEIGLSERNNVEQAEFEAFNIAALAE